MKRNTDEVPNVVGGVTMQTLPGGNLFPHVPLRVLIVTLTITPLRDLAGAEFAILVPLAITSNNAMIRRLGGAAWARLHRWVYLAAGAAAVHYLLVVKSLTMEPVVYAAIVGLLLSYRAVSCAAIRSRS